MPAWQATAAELEQNGFAVIEEALTSTQVERILASADEYVAHCQNAVRFSSIRIPATRSAANASPAS